MFDFFITALFSLLAVFPTYGSQGIQQLQQWRATAGRVELASSTAGLRISSLANLDCIGTDGDGDFQPGTCSGGGGGSGFSTTSADYWKSVRNFFSTTSASHFSALGLAFSTTSADYWETQQTARTADDLTNNSIEDLSDVAAITENLGDLFYWNGSSWADIATSSLNYSWNNLVGIPAGFADGTDDTGGGGSSFDYPFPSNATSTLLDFTAGLSIASHTVSTSTIVCKQAAGCEFTTIQSAIDAGHTSIYVRNGVYAEQLNLSAVKTQIVGESLNAIIQCNGSTQSPCVTADVDEFKLSNITVRETNAALVGTAIDFSNAALGLIEGVRVNNFATSTKATDTTSNTFYNKLIGNTFFNPRSCIDLGGSQPNATWSAWNRCRPMAVNGAIGLYLGDTRGFTSIADDFEGTTTSVTSTGIYVGTTSREISFTNPWVEANGTGINIAAGANRVTFTGGSITSNGTDITDNGTNTIFINTSDTGVLTNKFGAASTTALKITSIPGCTQALETDANGEVVCGTDATGGGGSGNVATSSAETSGRVPFWTSTAATPATLSGGSAAFAWNDSLSKLTTTNASTTNLSNSSILHIAAGSAASPSLRFTDTTSGIFTAGVDVSFAVSGSLIATVNAAGIRSDQQFLSNYSAQDATNVGYGWLGLSLGMYKIDNTTIGFSSGASEKFRITSNGATTTNLTVSGYASTTLLTAAHATTSSLYIDELTASRPVFTDANKRLTNTGTVGAIEAAVGSQNILLETEVDGCSELAGLLDAETGGCNGTSGPVFPDGPTFSGLATFARSTTSLASFDYASSTLYFGAGLADCHTGNMLTWLSGRFGCEADDGGAGGGLTAYDAWTHPTTGQSATTSLLLLNGNASTTRFAAGMTATTTIAANGAVGIFTDSPNSPLHIYSGRNAITGSSVDLALTNMRSQYNVATNGAATGISFGVSNVIDNAGGAAIIHERTGSNSQGKLHFATREDTGTGSIPIQATLDQNGEFGIGTTSPESKLDVWGESSAKILTLFSNTGTKFMEMLNTGVTTLLGTWDFSDATVKQHTYKSFSWPAGVANATTTTATTSIPLGSAFSAEAWNSGECWSGSGTIGWRVNDGTNLMDYRQATSTVSRFALATNNTFTASEKRFIDVGPITGSYISCTFDVTVNN